MSTALFKIVFEGSALPGVEPETAKANLAQLFKSDLLAIEKLFSGRKVALKRNLPQEKAERYLNALHKAGVDARIEAEPPQELTLEPLTFEPEPAPDAVHSPYAPPRAEVIDTVAVHGELKVFSFHGRIGRLRYLAWSLVLFAALFIPLFITGVMAGFAPIFGSLISSVLWIASVVVGLQICAQRLHDIGWSAWLALLNLIPGINTLLFLVLVCAPGTRGVSQYGAPPPPNTLGVKILASLWLVVVLALAAAFGMGLFAGLMHRYTGGTAL
ncbi:MAG: DUF805 domain-containing protein [Pseudomonas sp.]|uniref:DUF805 domain-containing protein n=1 Tax=Pseudomonas abieticivorans TaxID=2931382 RepID=UPI0020BF1E39|nr:DUF805 domain-containing protein [Pseudomonas sp. PIA16]MDE1168735.1 DUF805 domain-containing protein [Pseudomonas sp.]